MEPHGKLPWELEEDILSRLPPQSLVRFRSVCKRWNALLDENYFINNHLACARPDRFIFLTNSKIFSIDIIGLDGVDPKIELRELAYDDIPHREINLGDSTITRCDDFLLCKFFFVVKGTALWNPWSRQVKWIEYDDKNFRVLGLGYDIISTRPDEKVYKILGYLTCQQLIYDQRLVIYNCVSHAVKFIYPPGGVWLLKHAIRRHVSLNGNLYWVGREFFILSFDFSREIFKSFCLLPGQKNLSTDTFVLAVFKGDRFSLLKQSYNSTRNIEIWVTEKKVDSYTSGQVVWINMMTLLSANLPNLPTLYHCSYYGISYFIYDKTLIMCCNKDVTREACIYIVRGAMFKRIQIGSGFLGCCHCVYAPNFSPVPLGDFIGRWNLKDYSNS